MTAKWFVLTLTVSCLILFLAHSPEASLEKSSYLLELARKQFGELTESEEKFFKAASRGHTADYRSKTDVENNPANALNWGEGRILKASRVVWLCTDSKASALVDMKGISVKGARIMGNFQLGASKIPFRLFFRECAFDKAIDLRNAEIKGLVLSGSHTGPILAHLVKVEEYIVLDNGFKSIGGVNLVGAVISGYLNCRAGQFQKKGKIAVNCEQITVKEHVFFDKGFESYGQVRLAAAQIGGQLSCSGGKFINRGAESLSGNQMSVDEGVFLNNILSYGEVVLLSASINGNLFCNGGQFINEGSYALNGGSLSVRGHILMREGFTAKGQVSFLDSMVNGNFKAEGENSSITRGEQNEEEALILDGIRISGSLFIRKGFQVNGKVSLGGARIDGQFSCNGGRFRNEGKTAICADQMIVKQSVLLGEGFVSAGMVRITNMKIGGQLCCNGGQFSNKGAIALGADEIDVDGSIHMGKGFKSEGEVRLMSARIGGQLDCARGHFIHPKHIALNAEQVRVDKSVFLCDKFLANGKVNLSGAEINGSFNCTAIDSPQTLSLDLRSARIKTIVDDIQSWPQSGRLFLHGLVYEVIDPKAFIGVQNRINWLHLQPTTPFRPQPYEQLAKVFRKDGRDDEATQILITKNQDRAKFTQLTFFGYIWYRFFGKIIGYGYRPWNALLVASLFLFVGGLIFKIGAKAQCFTPKIEGFVAANGAKKYSPQFDQNPSFYAFLYSFDTFVPLINFHQRINWLPNTHSTGGKLIYLYLCFHTFCGWVLITLLIAGLTGLIKT